MMKVALLASVVCLGARVGVSAGVRAEPAPITLQSLLKEMVDRDALARFPDPPYTCRQFSSYDRASVGPEKAETWFANGDANQYLRVEEAKGADGKTHKEWVMADMDGPGAVVRIWSANPKGTLRVYLDGEAKAVIESPMDQILGGKWKVGDVEVGAPLSQECSKGWNLYLPIPYAKHCKITSDADGFYYQVNYRTYAGGTPVVSFPADPKDPQLEQINPKNVVLVAPTGILHRDSAEKSADLRSGESAEIYLPKGPGKVVALNLYARSPDSNIVTDPMLRKTVLSAEFDGERTVWCPFGDFAGSGVGVNPNKDWWRSVEANGNLSCLFPMPYRQTGKLKVTNFGDYTVRVHVEALYDNFKWDDRSMHFHASWRQQYPIHALGGKGTMDWNYVEVQGKGVYVGDNLAVMNPVPDWWGEGDEKIYVDGEKFPSHFGTGTEDYYGYAWCWPVVFQHPFHAQPRCDGNGKNNWGHTTVTRVRSLDAIPFTTSLKFDMEVWHWKECDEAYAATTYWYALPGSTSNRLSDDAIAAMEREVKKPIPQPPPLPPPFKIEGAVECEGMKVLAKSDGLTVIPQEMDGFAKQTWSGDSQLWVQGRRAGDFVELEIPTGDGPEGKAPRRVSIYATKSWDYGIIVFSINGQSAKPASGLAVDLFSGAHGKVLATGPIDVGVFTPKDGRLVLRAEVVGGNEKAEGSKAFFGLDAVVMKVEK